MKIPKDNEILCDPAEDILELTRDELALTVKYLGTALRRFTLACRPGTNRIATDCDTLFFDPVRVIAAYREDPCGLQRTYLHTVLHCLLGHPFRASGKEETLWDFCADLEAESILAELPLPADTDPRAVRRDALLFELEQKIPLLTAEFLYAHYRETRIEPSDLAEPAAWFYRDDHRFWHETGIQAPPERDPSGEGQRAGGLQEEWSRILKMESEQTRSKPESFPEALTQRMPDRMVYKENRYDAFLKRFAVTDEELREDPDAFDVGLYSYGLRLYGNMPLIEPLEYRETEKIKEFVIALDTSGSCRGEPIRAFLTRTYDIIKSAGCFSRKPLLYLLQADDRIRSCRCITCDRDLEEYLQNEKLTGFGETDFRPVFRWVEDQVRLGVLRHLRGLIYFTDGFGTFPDWAPPCESVFAFIKGNNNAAETPPWAVIVEFE